jgi:hypothetical protein
MSEPRFFDLLAATKRYRAGGPGPKATLMALMEHMGETEEGWACWPKMTALAFETEQDVRTVRRHIAAFEAAGLVERRSRGASGGGRASNLFVLDVQVLMFGTKPDTMSGQQTGHPAQANRTPDTEQTGHRAQVAPLIGTPSRTTKNNHSASATEFDAFYAAFPLHVGKAAAKKAWDKAVTKADPQRIIEGAQRYRVDPNRDPSFTAHPSTWLNAGRWDDEPLPPRSNGNGSVGARTVANVTAMHQRRALGPPPPAEVPEGGRFALRNGETATFTTTCSVMD